jgi:hypothetical protein
MMNPSRSLVNEMGGPEDRTAALELLDIDE